MGQAVGAEYDYVDSDVGQGTPTTTGWFPWIGSQHPTILDRVMVAVSTIGVPLIPPSPSALHRIYLPMVVR